jgi:geranylgeranyl pyrophosphate synthase
MKLLSNFQEQFNPKINLYLKEKQEQFRKIDKQAAFLIKIIKEFIGRGGKRFRPAIFYYS